MTKARRTPRPKDELKRELVHQLQFLQSSCEAFDKGNEAEGKRIALVIRVLVHEGKQSKALLAQLKLRDCKFNDSAGPIEPGNFVSDHNLVALAIDKGTARYVAIGESPFGMKKVRFQEWWNRPVIKDSHSKYFSRGDLVLAVCNTDGGAHVDFELDPDYFALSRDNSLGYRFRSGGSDAAAPGHPELACMRQIAYELLSTVRDRMPGFEKSVVAIPPGPASAGVMYFGTYIGTRDTLNP